MIITFCAASCEFNLARKLKELKQFQTEIKSERQNKEW